MTRTAARLVLATSLAVSLAALTGCTSLVDGQGERAGGSATRPSTGASSAARPPSTAPGTSSAPGTSTSAANGACPTRYAAPDPARPRVALRFAFAADLGTVTGTETVAFTPDRPITELVFRLTANTAPTVAEGNKIVVTSATADHGARAFTFSRANAARTTQGGLLHIPFAATVAPGTTVTARLGFTVTLGRNSFDRFGRTGGFAYLGSAQPLLAWERGYGWHTEDMIDFPAESATSEAMDTELTVLAPAGDTVIASGDPRPSAASGGVRTWRSHLTAARDVSVSVGPFVVADTTVGSVRLRVGAPTAAVRDLLVPEFRRAITALTARFGPFPFPSLSVARVPAGGGGIEYPSSILMLDQSRLVAVHETAHQWFYAMVGDSQALHPWMDEAFAQYAEQLVDGDTEGSSALSAPRPVDASTESYGTDEQGYYFTTYDKGAAALEAARTAAGPARWDPAIRCYVAANAWRIANPADLRRSLAALPAGIAVLRKAGALP